MPGSLHDGRSFLGHILHAWTTKLPVTVATNGAARLYATLRAQQQPIHGQPSDGAIAVYLSNEITLSALSLLDTKPATAALHILNCLSRLSDLKRPDLVEAACKVLLPFGCDDVETFLTGLPAEGATAEHAATDAPASGAIYRGLRAFYYLAVLRHLNARGNNRDTKEAFGEEAASGEALDGEGPGKEAHAVDGGTKEACQSGGGEEAVSGRESGSASGEVGSQRADVEEEEEESNIG
ncbi:PREDICTED: uncharacterized protein LOC106814958 [Priapulus caudatus]|uniref:Uncharacterized protein LOC106814958 n=1 Tax=Priapulus caudatus TaxID=37621 RepID=A0ABM1ERL9_PRICU|nr:PREDICTED: uncharacterized protein LOC106814958 [Priapulus caudatus]